MAFEIAGAGEAMLKQFGKQVFVFRDRNQAIAHVARREHAQLTAETPAGTALIAHRDDRSQVRDEVPLQRDVARANGVLLEPFEQSGKAGAAPNGNYTYPNGGAAPVLRIQHHPITLTLPGIGT